jgi:hypothetical protein
MAAHPDKAPASQAMQRPAGAVSPFYSFIAVAVILLLLLNCLAVFGIGMMQGSVAFEGATLRWNSWPYWRWMTQCITVFPIVLTVLIIADPYLSFMYIIHLIVTLIVIGWQIVFVVYGIIAFVQCTTTPICFGEAPLGLPWDFRANPDPFWITLFTLVSFCMLSNGVFVAINLYMRYRANLKLALAWARNGLQPVSAFALFEPLQGSLLDEPPMQALGAELDAEGRPAYSWYLGDHVVGEAVFVPPEELAECKTLLRIVNDRNKELVLGPYVPPNSYFFVRPTAPFVRPTRGF